MVSLRRLGAVFLAFSALSTSACKPVRYLFGWRARLRPDTTERAGGRSLVGAGDIGYCGLIGDRATATLLDQIPGAVFTTGDNAYPDGTLDDFNNATDPRGVGTKTARVRHPGNHEYHDGHATGYSPTSARPPAIRRRATTATISARGTSWR